MMAAYEIQGMAEVKELIQSLRAGAWTLAPMKRSLYRLQGHMGDYSRVLGPPVANYMRGRGRVNAAGVVKKLTSQNLGKRWTTEVRGDGNDIVGVAGNIVSYGPYVHDTERQAWMHRNRGAATTGAVLTEETPWIQNEWDVALRKAAQGGTP